MKTRDISKMKREERRRKGKKILKLFSACRLSVNLRSLCFLNCGRGKWDVLKNSRCSYWMESKVKERKEEKGIQKHIKITQFTYGSFEIKDFFFVMQKGRKTTQRPLEWNEYFSMCVCVCLEFVLFLIKKRRKRRAEGNLKHFVCLFVC